MMLARVCRATLAPQGVSFLKAPVVSKPTIKQLQAVRLFGNEGRTSFTRTAKARAEKTISERISAPAGDTAFNVGKGAIAGASALGIGALCFYGLGLSSKSGTIDNMVFWPEYVKDRVKTTYMYFGGSLLSSAAAATLCLRSPAVMRIVSTQGWIGLIGSLALMLGTGILAQSLPYKEGFGAKQMAWLLHTGVIGATLAPLSLFGGPLILRAALNTAGIVGGLSAIAICAPSEKFLNMGGPLAIGLGVVFASSLGTMFLPPTTALGAGLHSMALYGGLILFSAFLLYDTQKIIKRAENHPQYGDIYGRPFDPINNSISVYLDTINIFVRMVMILTGFGNRRK